MSFIESHETQAAIDEINKGLGFNLHEEIQVCGWRILVKVYVRNKGEKLKNRDGTDSIIEMPDSMPANDKYTTNVGLVLALGPYCFTGEQFKDHAPHCKVGDWVHFSQTSPSFLYRGIAMKYIFDSSVSAIVAKPEQVQLA